MPNFGHISDIICLSRSCSKTKSSFSSMTLFLLQVMRSLLVRRGLLVCVRYVPGQCPGASTLLSVIKVAPQEPNPGMPVESIKPGTAQRYLNRFAATLVGAALTLTGCAV